MNDLFKQDLEKDDNWLSTIDKGLKFEFGAKHSRRGFNWLMVYGEFNIWFVTEFGGRIKTGAGGCESTDEGLWSDGVEEISGKFPGRGSKVLREFRSADTWGGARDEVEEKSDKNFCSSRLCSGDKFNGLIGSRVGPAGNGYASGEGATDAGYGSWTGLLFVEAVDCAEKTVVGGSWHAASGGGIGFGKCSGDETDDATATAFRSL